MKIKNLDTRSHYVSLKLNPLEILKNNRITHYMFKFYRFADGELLFLYNMYFWYNSQTFRFCILSFKPTLTVRETEEKMTNKLIN